MTSRERPLTGNPYDPDERGELIGIGGQYTVHDIGDGRVVKIPNSVDGSRRFVGGWGPHIAEMKNKHFPLTETAYYRRYCVPHVLRLVARYPVLHDVLGRPQAGPGPCFTQDRACPLRDLIPEATPSEIRSYLDATADICQLLWRYGIHDYIWFFYVNNAVDARDKVVFLDFGEVAFDTAWVEGHVETREWETKDVLLKNLTPEYREHYFRAMKSRLSGRNFDRHWAHDLDDLDREIIKKPTLRERPEEIPALVDEILRRANREEGWQITGVSPDVLEVFRTYTWEGTDDEVTYDLHELIQSKDWIGGGVELENALYLAAESCRGNTIELGDIPQYLRMGKR